MPNIWFTSDTHYGHAKVIQYSNRPFKSVEEMEDIMVKDFNRFVGPKDVTYHLGDFAFLNTGGVQRVRSRLNGTIHLIKGNHDYKWSKTAFQAFDSVENLRELKIDGTSVVLCHFPIENWHKKHYGSYHLHGHSHGFTPFQVGQHRMDVGVDCQDYKPISWDVVKQVFEEKIDFKYKLRIRAEERYDRNV